MTRAQKVLLLVVVGELVGIAWLGVAQHKAPLPRLRLSRFEPWQASDVRRLADHMDRGKADAWVQLADEYRSFGLFNEAAYCFERGHELRPSSSEYLFYRAAAFDRAGRFEEALPRYHEAIAEDPPSAARCWLAIGLVHLRLGALEEAEEALNKAGELPHARLALARRLTRSGRAAEARRLLDEVLREFPADLYANQLRGWAEEELGSFAAAVPFEERSRRAEDQIAHSNHLSGPRDSLREANTGINRAVAHAEKLAQQGQRPEAIELLRTIPREASTPIFERVAGWQLELGRPGEAIETLHAGLDYLGPGLGELLELLGHAYTQAGEHQKGQAAWLQVAQIAATPELHRLLATSFARTGDLIASRRHLALAEFEVGKAAWLKNDLSAAKEHLEIASRSLEDHPHTWFYLAETLRLLDDRSGALAAYARCLRINPDHGRALLALERLGR